MLTKFILSSYQSLTAELFATSQSDGENQHKRMFTGLSLGIMLLWSVFQLWYASPLPYYFDFFVFNSAEARSIHLGFAILLAFLLYPTKKNHSSGPLDIAEFVLGVIGAGCAAYIFVFYVELSSRPGLPTNLDIFISVVGISVLLESTRRALGLPLAIVAIFFMVYCFAGPYMPDVVAHKGVGLEKASYHYWLSSEGVFGVALGVSTSMVFMFVLFGSLLESAGAGQFFIQLAYAGMGHLKGGPAKAAIAASGLTGIVSGSSIANVITTGTFTIPLMKKVGFSSEKAGAIEVAASTNGQLTPPVMGAAAFLMVEYVGIAYIDLIKHAILPALISYIALFYIVHLEASKLGLHAVKARSNSSIFGFLMSTLTGFLIFLLIGAGTYFGLGWIKNIAGGFAIYVIIGVILLVYLVLLKIGSKHLSESNFFDNLQFSQVLKSGMHFFLPIILLMWCLTVERMSPSLSAFWATVCLMFMVITQRPILEFYNRTHDYSSGVKKGVYELILGLASASKNMVGIGVATATAGLVVGSVTLTGIGLVMTDLIEFIAGDNLLLILLFTAVVCLILGMGLPTTANYIVVSSLMAPVIVTLGAENGLIVPLIAVHLFVFYFGILADDTPPVGLAAYAAAGISGGDPIKTGIQGFTYDLRTAVLPFMFLFNTEILLIGVNSWLHGLVVFVSATLALLLFTAATQRFFIIKNKIWESLVLLLVALLLFRPGIVWDKLYPPYESIVPTTQSELDRVIGRGDEIKIRVSGEKISGDAYTKVIVLQVDREEFANWSFGDAGLELRQEVDGFYIDTVSFGSSAAKAGFEYDQKLESLQLSVERPSKYFLVFPCLLVLSGVWFLQNRRKKLLPLR